MSKLFTNLLLPVIAIIFAFNSFGQHDHSRCGTDEELLKLYEKDPSLKKRMELSFSSKTKLEKSDDGDTLLIVPVVFHVLHEYGAEKVTLAEVQAHIDAMNEQYRNIFVSHEISDPVFDGIRGDALIEFRLAKIDPFGNCTNGVDYIYSKETNIGNDDSKYNQWDRSKYLNIWTIKTFKDRPTLLGYAMFPESVDSYNFNVDGVMIKSSEVDPYSSTLTHEIGHYLNLQHPWGSGNEPQNGCGGDDEVADTPPTQGFPSICPIITPNYSLLCTTPIFDVFMSFDNLKTTNNVDDITPIDSIDFIYAKPFKAVGVSSSTIVNGSFSFNNWPLGGVDRDTVFANQTGNINLNKYYETKIAVTENNFLEVSKITFKAQRNENGVKSIAIRSSIDNFSSNIPVTTNNSLISKIKNNTIYIEADTTRHFRATATISNVKNIEKNDTITFRIYAWNSEDVAGTFNLDSLTITGKRSMIENVENYMDYANCAKMFTKGQIERMRAALLSQTAKRNNLVSPENHIATGINTTTMCSPIADFSASITSVCTESQISFKDESWNAPVESWSWTFEDGIPATSTDESPVVSFSSPGYKKIKLVVTNAAGSSEITKDKYIFIGHNYGELVGPQNFSLDNGYEYWFNTENKENNDAKFEIVDGVGFNKSRCFKLNNYRKIDYPTTNFSDDYYYYRRLGGNKDAIITPSIDLSHTTDVSFSFKYAYATDGSIVNPTNQDIADVIENVKVYFSTNCGQSWNSISSSSTIEKGDLLTGGFAGNVDFIPSSNNLWKEFSANFTSSSNYNKMRFKIEFNSSDVSNNLYIDDIVINGVLGLSEEISELNLNVYPNPLSGNQEINVAYTAGNNPVELTLRNTQGQIVYNKTIETTNAPVNHTLSLDSKLSSSCYFLEVKNGEFKTVKKIIVL